jgi:hypothetical protein
MPSYSQNQAILSQGTPIYVGATPNFTPAATPTDIVVITGSATKLIRVLYMYVITTQTTAGLNQLFITKRSTDDTGGTSAGIATFPTDSNYAAATAVTRLYSANPTSLGTQVNGISVYRPKVLTPNASTPLSAPEYKFDFVQAGILKGIVLNGITEILALNFNGVALPTGFNASVTIIWTEE